ncbi:predicted protein [Chaetoceros tenuissimus]|uniref:Uncharacterized protein n=1 Tax=Chaetoceros tenuissimus TaxID=426638 RepID=A0AAD3DBV9_9STRA|nr:predicted protein [Chaetoceros tenuissimus]
MEIKLKNQSEDWIPSNERLNGQKQIMISDSVAPDITFPLPKVHLKSHIFPETKISKRMQLSSGSCFDPSSEESISGSTFTNDSAQKDSIKSKFSAQKEIFCSTSVSERTAATVPTFTSDGSTSTQKEENCSMKKITEVAVETNICTESQKEPNISYNTLSTRANSNGLRGSVYERLSQTHTYSSMNLRKSLKPTFTSKETNGFIKDSQNNNVKPAIQVENRPPRRPSQIISRSSRGNTHNTSVHDRLASQFTKSTFDKRRTPTPIRSSSPKPFFNYVKDISCNSFVEESHKEHRNNKNTLLKASFSDNRKSLSFTSRSSGDNTPNASVHDRLASQFTKSSFDKRRTPTPIRSASPTPFFSYVRDNNSFNTFLEKRDEKIPLPPRNSKKLKSLARDATLYRLSKQHTKSSADKCRKLPVRHASPKPFYTVVTSGSVSSLSEVTMHVATPTRKFYPSIVKDSMYTQQSEEEQTAVSEMKKKKYKMQSNIQNLPALVQANAKYVSSRSFTASSLHETKKIVESENKRIVQKKDYDTQGDLYTRLMNRANQAAMKKKLMNSIPASC